MAINAAEVKITIICLLQAKQSVVVNLRSIAMMTALRGYGHLTPASVAQHITADAITNANAFPR